MRPAVVLHREDKTHRSRRVAGDGDRHHFQIAEDNRLPFREDLIALRPHLGGAAGAPPPRAGGRILDQVPIRGRDIDLRAKAVLHVPRSAHMVGMAVAGDDDLHLCRIEAQLLKARQEQRVHLRGAQRINHQEAVRGLDDIDRGAGVADGVHVVEDLRRHDDRVGGTVGARRFAEEMRLACPHRAAGLLRFLDQRFHLGRIGLGGRGRRGCLRSGEGGKSRGEDHEARELLE